MAGKKRPLRDSASPATFDDVLEFVCPFELDVGGQSALWSEILWRCDPGEPMFFNAHFRDRRSGEWKPAELHPVDPLPEDRALFPTGRGAWVGSGTDFDELNFLSYEAVLAGGRATIRTSGEGGIVPIRMDVRPNREDLHGGRRFVGILSVQAAEIEERLQWEVQLMDNERLRAALLTASERSRPEDGGPASSSASSLRI